MYRENVKNDVLDYIRWNYSAEEIRENLENRESWAETLNEDCWANDSVTGNASGSYFCNSCKAREAVLEDLDTVCEALREFGVGDGEIFVEDWEYLDVTARCYVLYAAIEEALDELEA